MNFATFIPEYPHILEQFEIYGIGLIWNLLLGLIMLGFRI